MEVQILKNVVYKILDTVETARNDDYILYAWVCNDLGVDLSMSLGEFLFKHTCIKMPNFKTVERCRRKWQEKNPDLVSKKTKEAREKEKDKYIELSKE